jgi:hypothetical protein
VLDGVGVVRVSLLKELLKAIHGRPHLMFATTYTGRCGHNIKAALLLVAADITGRRCSLLTGYFWLFLTLVVPSPASWMMTSGDTSPLLLGVR